MNQIFELSKPVDASPRFSPEKAIPFSSLNTASSVLNLGSDRSFGIQRSDQATKIGHVSLNPEPINAKLFAATAQAKIWTSKVAMHLDKATRDRLFRQLDFLHDSDEWVDDGEPVQLESYKSCVRAMLYHHIDTKPSLALMPSGYILALWQDGEDKLSLEFMPQNKVRWMVQSRSASGPERAAGVSPIERLRAVLEPYGANRWFNAA